jgi:hypothetical protein
MKLRTILSVLSTITILSGTTSCKETPKTQSATTSTIEMSAIPTAEVPSALATPEVQKNKEITPQPTGLNTATSKTEPVKTPPTSTKIKEVNIPVPVTTTKMPTPTPIVIAENKPAPMKEKETPKPTAKQETPETSESAKPNHALFNTLLSEYVSVNGNVDYKGIKANKAKLEAYLKELDNKTTASDWSREEKLAYWINAYNAHTIKLIIDNYPVAHITDLSGGKPWDVKSISIGGKKYSLNNIENDIIRPQFKDPRIHFAVNCAAKSCPPLANQAYTATNLNQLLETRTRKFINSSANTISPNTLNLCKIFEWYATDFGDLKTYISKYAKSPIDNTPKITYKEYDWSLNE